MVAQAGVPQRLGELYDPFLVGAQAHDGPAWIETVFQCDDLAWPSNPTASITLKASFSTSSWPLRRFRVAGKDGG
jgi:hypothetical protein